VKRYGARAERMVHLEGLPGAQSLCCFLWALAILQFTRLTGRGKGVEGASAPWHAYWKTGVANSFGPALGMIALKNITYSAQVG